MGAGCYCKRHMKYFRKDSSRKYCPKPRRDSEDFLSSPCVSDCRSGYQWSLLLRFLNQSGKCPWLEEILNPKVFALNYYFMLIYCGLYHLIWKCCGDVIITTVEIKNQKMLKIENGKLFKSFHQDLESCSWEMKFLPIILRAPSSFPPCMTERQSTFHARCLIGLHLILGFMCGCVYLRTDESDSHEEALIKGGFKILHYRIINKDSYNLIIIRLINLISLIIETGNWT